MDGGLNKQEEKISTKQKNGEGRGCDGSKLTSHKLYLPG